MPSVRELAEQLSVNPNTVQRVYQEMERNGWLFTRRGQGTYVTEDASRIRSLRQELALESVRRCIAELRELGFRADQIVELVRQSLPPAERQEGELT